MQSDAQGSMRGYAWYSGADCAWIRIVFTKDTDGLLTYGVRGQSDIDLSAQSAFFLDEVPMTDLMREGTRNGLRLALQHWRRPRYRETCTTAAGGLFVGAAASARKTKGTAIRFISGWSVVTTNSLPFSPSPGMMLPSVIR